jgi:hypothetical protein
MGPISLRLPIEIIGTPCTMGCGPPPVSLRTGGGHAPRYSLKPPWMKLHRSMAGVRGVTPHATLPNSIDAASYPYFLPAENIP